MTVVDRFLLRDIESFGLSFSKSIFVFYFISLGVYIFMFRGPVVGRIVKEPYYSNKERKRQKVKKYSKVKGTTLLDWFTFKKYKKLNYTIKYPKLYKISYVYNLVYLLTSAIFTILYLVACFYKPLREFCIIVVNAKILYLDFPMVMINSIMVITGHTRPKD